jgi:S1-C subfamily serine protease
MQSRDLLVPVLSFGMMLVTAAASGPQQAMAAVPSRTGEPYAPLGSPPQTLAPMLAGVAPAVVNVSVQTIGRQRGGPRERDLVGGSGVILDAGQGFIITNSHLVERAERIQVTLKDRRRFEASVVGMDPQTDIAVLKVQPDRLTAISVGDSRTLQVGDYVVAIGNPFGLGQTATFGIISALGRTGLGLERYEDFIQTDASINPGNSGGALVDLNGRLIGINAAILSQNGGNIGVGFAIPIEMANSVAKQLIATGRASHGALGVAVEDLTPDQEQAMGNGSGALVSQVQPRSAAARAGIQGGDLIAALDGQPITSSSQLRSAIGQKQPGATVWLSLMRNGRQRVVTTTLDPLPVAASAWPKGF